MINRTDYCYFAERALDGMTDIVARLGDDLANRRPALPHANTPYALLNHCLGVISYWVGALVAGRPTPRDRAAEFTAAGPVAPLLARATATKAQFRADVHACAPDQPLRAIPDADFLGPARDLNQGGALLHVYEELAQHHGQLEILRDCLLAGVIADV